MRGERRGTREEKVFSRPSSLTPRPFLRRCSLNPYVIDGGQAGKQRLRLLASVMEPTTSRLFDRLGLRMGMTCLDVGSGGGDVTLLLAGRVGPTGRVVGVDFDRDILRLAETEAQRVFPGRVEYRWADAENLQLPSTFNFVYARFLLSHLRHPQRCLAGMIAAVQPGGWIATEDIDFEGQFCHPPSRAVERYGELYQAVVRRKGADPTLGRKLPALFLEAGLKDVQFEVLQPTFRTGPGKRLAEVTMARIATAVVAEGLAEAAEVEAITAELEAYARDETTVLSAPRVVQCWARRSK